MPSSTRSTLTALGRARLVVTAVFCRVTELAVLKKAGVARHGALTRFDRRLLNGVHRLMLTQIERMRRTTADRTETVLSRKSPAGVHNAEVVLSASDPAWAAEATREAEELRRTLGDDATVHHIGSTAVAGLTAKPIVDLAVALPAERFAEELPRAAAALDRLGYRYVGVRGGYFFEKERASVRTHALQVHASDSAVLADLLWFRDALQRDDALRKDYTATKVALAAHFSRHRVVYFIYKSHWIQEQLWHHSDLHTWAEWLAFHKGTPVRLAKGWRPATGG